jgi:hypothetical protein
MRKYWDNETSDLVRKHRSLVAEYLGKQLVERHGHEYMQRSQALRWVAESPIESVFAMWWGVITAFHPEALQPEPLPFSLIAQQTIELVDGSVKRADFCLMCTDATVVTGAAKAGREWVPVLIEIDGHTYHERTREQVTDRNQRDRDLQAAGFIVLHFSFDEVSREPHRCIAEVLSAAFDQYRDLRGAALAADEGRPS